MHARKPPAESLMLRAAEARAEGGSWDVVGKRVRRSPHTVRKWPLMYPERWEAALRAADRRVIDDAAAESVLVLRQLVRSANDKIRQQAAWRLIYQRLELSKIELRAAALATTPPPSDAQLIAAFVEAHPRDQLIRLAANLLNARVPQRLAVQTDEAAGGS